MAQSKDSLSDGYTAGVFVYITLELMYLHEKTLQERQQALFLEFHGKSITRLSSYTLASAKEKKATHQPLQPYIRSVCVGHDYPIAFPQLILIHALYTCRDSS